MNAVQLLRDDHETVRELFRQYRADDSAKRQATADQALMELEIHSKLEEEIFYPAFRQRSGQEGREQVAEAYEEHAQVDQLVAQLQGMHVSDPRFQQMFQELMQNVEHHVKEEEAELLPEAEELMGDQLDQLGETMMQRKQQLMTQLQSQTMR